MDEFIKMTKDGEIIEVHPLAVENHKQLGWTVVKEEQPAEAAQEAEQPKVKGSRKKKSG